MSWRLKLAVACSILVHAALFLGLFLYSFWKLERVTTLTGAGGVIWYNLNPGGEGSGGQGGAGAPKEALEKAPQNTKPDLNPSVDSLPPKVQKSPLHEKDHSIPEKKKATVAAVRPPEAEEMQKNHALPPQSPLNPYPGPGEGDTSGNKTGPGVSEGKGLGPGKGSGQGPGEGPGGIGLPGTGGSGSGGEGNNILAQIRQKILHAKRYPRLARSQGIEGSCGLKFGINPDGSVNQVQLTQSSGSDILDDEALATVKRAAPFPYYPGAIRFSLKFNLKED